MQTKLIASLVLAVVLLCGCEHQPVEVETRETLPATSYSEEEKRDAFEGLMKVAEESLLLPNTWKSDDPVLGPVLDEALSQIPEEIWEREAMELCQVVEEGDGGQSSYEDLREKVYQSLVENGYACDRAQRYTELYFKDTEMYEAGEEAWEDIVSYVEILLDMTQRDTIYPLEAVEGMVMRGLSEETAWAVVNSLTDEVWVGEAKELYPQVKQAIYGSGVLVISYDILVDAYIQQGFSSHVASTVVEELGY